MVDDDADTANLFVESCLAIEEIDLVSAFGAGADNVIEPGMQNLGLTQKYYFHSLFLNW